MGIIGKSQIADSILIERPEIKRGNGSGTRNTAAGGSQTSQTEN